MSSEKILIKIFNNISGDEFRKDKFLEEVYKCWKKESKNYSKSTFFEFYMEFLIRNKTFTHNEKIAELHKLYKEIVNSILNNDDVNVGFIDQKEKTQKDEFIHQEKTQQEKTQQEKTQKEELKHSKKTLLDKDHTIKILSDYVQQSSIVTETEVEVEEDTNTVSDMINEVSCGSKYIDIHGNEIKEEGRIIPKSKPDEIFKRRSEIMNIWRDTESKCQELNQIEAMSNLINKLYFIDTTYINRNLNYIQTITMQELDLTEETIKCAYTNSAYNTTIRLINATPLSEAINKVKERIRSIYILSGSQMVIGGNADQGIETNESDIYLTSTYSSAIEKILYAFPLQLNQFIICPKVLVFKNLDYKLLPASQWEKVVVMNSPCKFRPKLSENNLDFANMIDKEQFKKSIQNSIELSLFMGYDTIILDDRGIQDNNLPAEISINIIKESIDDFHGRVKEFNICIKDPKLYNLFKKQFRY
jgi:hypothetical protein